MNTISTPMAAEWGGKGASLEKLASISRVPPFAVLNASAFRDFLDAADLLTLYRESWTLALISSQDIQGKQIRDALQKWCLCGPIPPLVQEQIEKIYQGFADKICVARSSATLEDGPLHSWAGQFDTFTGIDSLKDWEMAVRKCWASLMRGSVPAYASARKLADSPPEMAVVIQEMLDAKAAGVWFPFDPASGAAGALLECTLGLGGPLVSGRITPERWQADPGNLPKLKQNLRAGKVQLLARQPAAEPGEGRLISPWIEIRKDTEPVQDRIWTGYPVCTLPEPMPVLTPDEAAGIMAEAQDLANQQAQPVEMEWAMDSEGRVWWLQMRPVTSASPPAPAALPIDSENEVLARGLCAHPGRIEGIVWEYGNPRPAGDTIILVKEELSPQDVELSLSVSGMVARDGSLLSHTAIVCREFGTPCLVDAHPFPPDIRLQGRKAVLDASRGVLLADGVLQDPPPNLVAVVPEMPHQLPQVGLSWPDSVAFQGKVPASLQLHLKRISRLPGIVSQVEVLPDLRERPPSKGIGFPIGLVFRSTCYHPGAVCDMGDGFRLMSLSGVDQKEISERLPLLEAELNQVFSEQQFLSLELKDIFENGLDALRGTEWEETAFELVEERGKIEGADGRIFEEDSGLWQMAQSLLSETGESSHFLDLYFPGPAESDEPDSRANPILLLHSGAVDLGLEFLALALERGRKAAYREGLYDPDTIQEGLFGIEVAGLEGRELLKGAWALTNYGFVRRRILQVRIEQAFQRVFGKQADLQLISDVLHTAVRLDGDGLLHQQGVQARKPGGLQLPIALSSAPRAISYLLRASDGEGRNWCPHGKIYLPPEMEFRQDEVATHWEEATSISSDPGSDGGAIGTLHAQAREALEVTCREANLIAMANLFPVFCYRGLDQVDDGETEA